MEKSSFFKKLHIRPLDILLFAVFTAVAAVSVVELSRSGSGKAVLIVDSPGGEYVYDLSVNRELKIRGLLGYSIIRISSGSAFFVDSACPNKTCVQCAPIRHNGEWIACMPNQVFIRIESKAENGADISSF